MDTSGRNVGSSTQAVDFGPLASLMQDDSIGEIHVDDFQTIYVERGGKWERAAASFRDETHLMQVIQDIAMATGSTMAKNQPIAELCLADGSRINVVLPPLAFRAACLTIRKAPRSPITLKDLIETGALTAEVAEFLKAAVISKLNIVVCGGSSSGKTTMLNALASGCPVGARIVTIEKAPELRLQQPHTVTLTLPQTGAGGIVSTSFRDALRSAARMHPGWLIVDDAQGEEMLDLLEAKHSVVSGILCATDGLGPKEVVRWLEVVIARASFSISLRIVREEIASLINLIVHVAQLQDGSRRVMSVTETETAGIGEVPVSLRHLFVFEQSGWDRTGVIGRLQPTRLRPRCIDRIEDAGIHLPPEIFGRRVVRPVEVRRKKPTPGYIHILIADSQAETRTNIGKLFAFEPDFEVISQCDSGEETIQQVVESQPDVALIGLPLPGMDHLGEIEALARGSSATRIVVVIAEDAVPASWASLPRGLKAILVKPPTVDALVEAVRYAAQHPEQSPVRLYGLARSSTFTRTLARTLGLSEEAARDTAVAFEQRGLIRTHADADGQMWLVARDAPHDNVGPLELGYDNRTRGSIAGQLLDEVDGTP